MEGIITLIVIIIAFNLFNALMKAVRGGQQSPQKKVLVSPEPLSPHENGQQWTDDEIRFRPKKKEKRADSYDGEGTDAREAESADDTGAWQAPEPVKKEVASSSPVIVGLQQTLTCRDPLLAAFIFHEILEPPPSLRRKR